MGRPASFSMSFLIHPTPKACLYHFSPLCRLPPSRTLPLRRCRARAAPSTCRHVAPVTLASHIAAPTARSVGRMGGGGDRTPTDLAQVRPHKRPRPPGGATDTGAPIWPPLPLSCASISAYTASLSTVRAPSAVSFALGCLCPSSVR